MTLFRTSTTVTSIGALNSMCPTTLRVSMLMITVGRNVTSIVVTKWCVCGLWGVVVKTDYSCFVQMNRTVRTVLNRTSILNVWLGSLKFKKRFVSSMRLAESIGTNLASFLTMLRVVVISALEDTSACVGLRLTFRRCCIVLMVGIVRDIWVLWLRW